MTDETVHFPCPLFSNSTVHEAVVVNIRVSLSVFSLFGSLFVIILIWLFKKYKFFTQRLILYLTISSLISSIAYCLIMAVQVKIHFVYFQVVYSFMQADWSVLLSTLGITFNLFLKVIRPKFAFRFEIVYFLLSFAAPVLFIWIPFTVDSYGPSGAWCWIRDKYDNCTSFPTGKILQFVTWYVPLYLLIAVLFIIYLCIIVIVRLQVKQWQGIFNPHTQRQRVLLKEEIKPLLRYPVIYLCVQLFPLINRIVLSATDTANFPLFVLHVATSPLTGVLIAFAYALDKDTLRRLNWRSIKANLMFRSTDQMVKPYHFEVTQEEELEKSAAKADTTDTEDERRLETTPFNRY